MFPMRSIELSIILLQPVDGSSRDEEGGVKKGGRGRREQVASVFSRFRLTRARVVAMGELCAAMQMHCPVCLATPAAEDKTKKNHKTQEREREGETDRHREREGESGTATEWK